MPGFKRTVMALAMPIVLPIALAAPAAGIAQALPDYPTADAPPPGDAFPAQITEFSEGVTATADVIYKVENGFRPLTMDIYRQTDVAEPRPLVLYIHGGGWQSSHKRAAGVFTDFPGVLADLASHGYVTASAEYRLSGEAPFPAAEYDVKAAIRYLRAHADDYGIDPERIAIWGSSAGGHLASLAAVTCDGAGLAPYAAEQADVSDCVNAAAIWYGVFDFAHGDAAPRASLDRGVVNRFLGCDPGACPDYLIEASGPIYNVDKDDPAFLLVHGEQDRIVPVTQSRALEARLKEAGVPVETMYVPGVDHSLVAEDPEQTRQAALEAVARTFRFFDEQLQGH